ncbi:hypothetical protein DY000_02021718 [Brassica cretica]|uniref:Secreted protein n=1 Tax=Brassica cretica TaxID=69181 RepID=A0ABQ7ECD9_BRACR|nr:hypothetical protein DY000_02021718 [Brassica cretica]
MTSGLAMLLVRACGAEKFVPWTLLERAEASCVFMLELNFHSGSSIYSSQWFACLASHTSRSISSVTHPSFFPFQMRLTSRSDCYRAGALGGFSQMFERWMMSQFDRLLRVTAMEAWLFCKLVGIAFGLGCDNLRCVILELHLLCLEGRLVQRLVRDGVAFCDIILAMDLLSRHQVLLDCLMARVHISGA